jgi:phage shock protein C
MPSGRLRRSTQDRIIGGVLGGIARHYDLDPVLVRIAYVVLSILSAGFPGTLVYIILWIVIPTEDSYERW